MAGTAPAAIVFEVEEPILTLGALVAWEVFGRTIPMASVGSAWFRKLATARRVSIDPHRLVVEGAGSEELVLVTPHTAITLSERDRAMLEGREGGARQLAMRIVQRFADVVGARELIDVTQAHIDCCFYTGRRDWRSQNVWRHSGRRFMSLPRQTRRASTASAGVRGASTRRSAASRNGWLRPT